MSDLCMILTGIWGQNSGRQCNAKGIKGLNKVASVPENFALFEHIHFNSSII